MVRLTFLQAMQAANSAIVAPRNVCQCLIVSTNGETKWEVWSSFEDTSNFIGDLYHCRIVCQCEVLLELTSLERSEIRDGQLEPLAISAAFCKSPVPIRLDAGRVVGSD
jgi:hypothetical protein